MDFPTHILWHGTATGPQDNVLRAITTQGLSKAFNNPRISGQTSGVYFAAAREYAIERALRCVGKLQRGGRPVLMGIETDLSPDEWDWDYEVSQTPVNQFLRALRPAGIISSVHNDYARTDYRHSVRNTEQACHNLREENTGHYRTAFANAITAQIKSGAQLAFKYTGATPLRVKTIEFI